MKTHIFGKVMTLFIATTLLVSACVKTDETATPTPISIEAISTSVAATVFAGQTGTAAAQPTLTLTPTFTITPTGTITSTPTATRAVYAPIQPIIYYTVTPTITGTPFTATPTITGTFGAVGCNNSAFVQDVSIPNNTKLDPGQSFTKTWRIKNTGTCAWTYDYKFTYIGGELFNSDTRKIRTTVGVGGTLDLSLTMVAPTSPGTYSSYWRMANTSGQLFGSSFSITIVIPGATYTPTKAVTVTNTSVAPTITNTSVAPTITNTFVPATVTSTLPAPTVTLTATPPTVYP